jgi:hypothetical protein
MPFAILLLYSKPKGKPRAKNRFTNILRTSKKRKAN